MNPKHFITPAAQAQIIEACRPYRETLAQLRNQRELRAFQEQQSKPVQQTVPDFRSRAKDAVLLQPSTHSPMRNVLIRAEFNQRDRRFAAEPVQHSAFAGL